MIGRRALVMAGSLPVLLPVLGGVGAFASASDCLDGLLKTREDAEALVQIAKEAERTIWAAYLNGRASATDYSRIVAAVCSPKWDQAWRIRQEGQNAYFACQELERRRQARPVDPGDSSALLSAFGVARSTLADAILKSPREATAGLVQRAIDRLGNGLFDLFLTSAHLRGPSPAQQPEPYSRQVQTFLGAELRRGTAGNPLAQLIASHAFDRFNQIEGAISQQMAFIDQQIDGSPPGSSSTATSCSDLSGTQAMDLAVDNPQAYERLLAACKR